VLNIEISMGQYEFNTIVKAIAARINKKMYIAMEE
jgi:hypothetical protein